MENMLRNLVLFVWSVLFGFFSLTAYLDDTMAAAQKTMIVVGLVVVLLAYIGMEWFTRKRKAPSPLERVPSAPSSDERILRRLHGSFPEGGSSQPSPQLNPRPAPLSSPKDPWVGKP